MSMSESSKRKARIGDDNSHDDNDDNVHKQSVEAASTLSSLSRPISPPRKKQRSSNVTPPGGKAVRSPWQLTWIRDLPESQNRDAVTLKDLLGDPLISECWEFNYLHDVNFLMDAFDADVRHLVKVHIVHGFWKNEDPNRLQLTVRSSHYSLASRGVTQVHCLIFWDGLGLTG